jgi:hypothetical protein
MPPMRSPLLLPLLVCMAMLPLGGSARAERIDLTAYLAPVPASGDYRTYATSRDGNLYQERYDVTAVEGRGSGWLVGWEREVTGGSYGELVRPGARVRSATADDSTPPGCRSAVHYDLRTCDLRLRIGQKRPFRFGYLDSDYTPGFPAFPFPTRYHWAQFRGSYVAEGFEPIETPYASHASALKLVAVVREYRASVQRDGWKVVSRGPLRFESVETRQSWYVEGVGIVALRVTPGVPRDSATSAPTLEMWLKEGLVEGLPYPPP